MHFYFVNRKMDNGDRWTLENAFKLDLNLHKYSYIPGHQNLDILFRGTPGQCSIKFIFLAVLLDTLKN